MGTITDFAYMQTVQTFSLCSDIEGGREEGGWPLTHTEVG